MGHKVKQSSMSSRIDFFYYAFRNVLLVSVPLLIFSIFVFTIPHSSAEISSGTDNVQLVLSTSCTVNAVVTSEHTVSLNGGQLDNNVGNTKLSAYCNDNNGYSIYAVGSSGDIDGNTDLINTVNESYNIHTGVYDDTIQTNPSSWAMKLTAGTGTGIDPVTGESVPTTPPTIVNGFDNYSTIPNVYTQVAKRTSGTSMITDSDASGSYLNTTYQIYANSYQPAGTYNGKVKYVIVHPNSNNNTIPDLDTAFAVAGKMKVYEEGDKSYYAMQDMDSQICSFVANTGASTATQLVDTRDNNLYWVAKLEDGKCWMTSNLDLDIGGLNTAPLNSNNTDISTTASGSGIYSAGYTEQDGVWTWTPVSTAITSTKTITYPASGNPAVSGWTNNNTLPYSAESGNTYYYTSNTTANDTRFNSLQACKDASHTEDECKRYFAGNYYNWTAAIASNNSTGIGSTVGEIASSSICPKGWRLPNISQTDNVNNEFGRMLYGEGITAALSNGNESVGYYNGVTSFNKLRSNPYYFVRSGEINGSTLSGPGVYGLYWSSTVSSSTVAYLLSFNDTNIYPARSSLRYYGRSVRCVAR